MIITPLLYLLGSFYGFIASDFTKNMNIKLTILAGMVMFLMTYIELYKNSFRLTGKIGKSIGYNVGMLAVMSMAAFMYSTLVGMVGKKL